MMTRLLIEIMAVLQREEEERDLIVAPIQTRVQVLLDFWVLLALKTHYIPILVRQGILMEVATAPWLIFDIIMCSKKENWIILLIRTWKIYIL